MSGHGEQSGEHMVDVMLVGGPTDIPESERRVRVAAATSRQKIKIRHYGGYQHFEPSDTSGESTGQQPRIFRWTGFTKIAE